MAGTTKRPKRNSVRVIISQERGLVQMKAEQLAEILEKHRKWLNNEESGEYADLRSADLSGADLRSARTDKQYIVISCIGSRKDSTVYCLDDDEIWCGCFYGNLAEFEQAVNETHANNPQYLKEYTGAIAYIRSLQVEQEAVQNA